MNAIELFGPNGQSIDVWLCGECRSLQPVWNQKSQSYEYTKTAAEKCCSKLCEHCGSELPRDAWRGSHRHVCEECRRKATEKANADHLMESLRDAKNVTGEYSGRIFDPSEQKGDGFFESVDALVERCKQDSRPIPTWVFACTSRAEHLDPYDCIDRLCDDGYEGMRDFLDVPDYLKEAADRFNEEHKSALTIYEPDYSQKIRTRGKGEPRPGSKPR